MSTRTGRMSVGFIAVVALVAGAVLALPGNAWADLTINEINTPYTFSTGSPGHVTLDGHNAPVIGTVGSGVTVTGNGDLDVGVAFTNTATLAISGGSYNQGGSTVRLGDNGSTAASVCTLAVSGTGIFSNTGAFQIGGQNSYFDVTGGLASLTVHDPYFNFFGGSDKSIGGLKFTLDNSAGHISPLVSMGGGGNNGFNLSDANNAGKIDMALSGFTPAQNQVFDIIQSDRAIGVPGGGAASLLNAGDVGTWSLSLANDNQTLQATYLAPEPATMALLAVGGVGMLIRRRSRKS